MGRKPRGGAQVVWRVRSAWAFRIRKSASQGAFTVCDADGVATNRHAPRAQRVGMGVRLDHASRSKPGNTDLAFHRRVRTPHPTQRKKCDDDTVKTLKPTGCVTMGSRRIGRAGAWQTEFVMCATRQDQELVDVTVQLWHDAVCSETD